MWQFIRRLLGNQRPAPLSEEDAENLESRIRRHEPRHELKIFVSHRWGLDRDLYEFVSVFEGRVSGVHIKDLSLPPQDRITNARGRDADNLKVKANIARRMAEADLIVTSSIAMRRVSDWVLWELELAAFGLRKPILFVDHRPDLQLPTRLIADFKSFGAEVYRARRSDNGGVNFAQAFAQILEAGEKRSTANSPPDDDDGGDTPSHPLH